MLRWLRRVAALICPVMFISPNEARTPRPNELIYAGLLTPGLQILIKLIYPNHPVQIWLAEPVSSLCCHFKPRGLERMRTSTFWWGGGEEGGWIAEDGKKPRKRDVVSLFQGNLVIRAQTEMVGAKMGVAGEVGSATVEHLSRLKLN